MMNKQLGVCVVGAGMMGTLHAQRWNRVPHAQVVAVVDIQADRAKKLAHDFAINHSYTDYKHAISQPEVHVVSVCVPTHLHAEVAIFAAEQGKHVLCEKPVALTLREADAMIEAAQKHNVRLSVGFMRRYSLVHEELRAWLAAGELGRPVMYHAVDLREIRAERELHDAHASGGPILDIAVHHFDGWAHAFDSHPVQVFAHAHKLAQGRPELGHIKELAYDTATIVVRYASGDTGTFVVSWGLPPGVNPPPVPDQILGPKGLAELQYHIAFQQLRVLKEGNQWSTVSAAETDLYQAEVQTFADCIVGAPNEQAPATGEDGKAALKVALAALQSLETGQAVNL
ncbi:MAG: Gfo/Idh/MocA family oxidoreductase [Anaerolineae bacterium]